MQKLFAMQIMDFKSPMTQPPPRRGIANRKSQIANSFLFLILAFIGGCAMPRVPQPLTQTVGGNDADMQAEFWYQMSERPLACNDEAFHALLLYLDNTDPANDYTTRVAELRRRKMLPTRFDRPGDEGVERGTFAVALVQAMRIKGGVMLTMLGPTPRYATRELQYLNLYPPSSPEQGFSGTELVGIIGRVEDYQRGNPANVPATVLPSEMAEGQAKKP
jgi:hypothetical protein